MIACTDLQEQLKNYSRFMEKIVKVDEMWIYGYDPETKSNLHNGRVLHLHIRVKTGNSIQREVNDDFLCFMNKVCKD